MSGKAYLFQIFFWTVICVYGLIMTYSVCGPYESTWMYVGIVASVVIPITGEVLYRLIIGDSFDIRSALRRKK